MNEDEELKRTERLDRLVFPARTIDRFTAPFIHFLRIQSASGIVLIACAATALAVANSVYGESYQAFWNQPFRVGFDWFELDYPLWYWVNDGLMTIFFFVIGLEIKRELVTGELSEPSRIVLPVAAAIGGAVVPVGIFFALLQDQPGQSGWAVPMATDIAFMVGCLALLGERIPQSLKILMLSLSIVDDLVAVVVIAIFYSEGIDFVWLSGAGLGLVLVVAMNRVDVRAVSVYVVVGVAIWLCTLKSGIHPTIAGVALGLLTPASAWLGGNTFLDFLDDAAFVLKNGSTKLLKQREMLTQLSFASRETVSPVVRIESGLHPWVAFLIMPIFALANAGVAIDASALSNDLAVAVAAGLVIGKPVGIFSASLLVTKTGLGSLPPGLSWPKLFGASCLAGIGFTMALFIASLGLEGSMLDAAKVGIIAGSFISACVGMTVLSFTK